jgi:hypothetical protein
MDEPGGRRVMTIGFSGGGARFQGPLSADLTAATIGGMEPIGKKRSIGFQAATLWYQCQGFLRTPDSVQFPCQQPGYKEALPARIPMQPLACCREYKIRISQSIRVRRLINNAEYRSMMAVCGLPTVTITANRLRLRTSRPCPQQLKSRTKRRSAIKS